MTNKPDREAFEAWWTETMNIAEWDLHPFAGSQYACHETNRGWMIWQAAIAHERAECAKVCENFGRSYDNEWNQKLGVANDLKDTCDECAAAIRARS